MNRYGNGSITATSGTPGSSCRKALIAAMYGGLCAGARKLNSSIAARNASSTICGAFSGPVCTALNPTASISPKPRSGLPGPAISLMHLRIAAWQSAHSPPGCPIRSTRPCASTVSP